MALHTRQVNYVNVFAQADLQLKKAVLIEMTQGYSDESAEDSVLKLNKILYGIRQDPVIFFEP